MVPRIEVEGAFMGVMPESTSGERWVTRPTLRVVVEEAPGRTARRPRRLVVGLCELYQRRDDLRGTYPPADYLEEAIRWSV